MASTLKFDSERRAMRRERHEARVARKRERQQARELKHVQQGESARMNREIASSAAPTPSPGPGIRSRTRAGAEPAGNRGRGGERCGGRCTVRPQTHRRAEKRGAVRAAARTRRRRVPRATRGGDRCRARRGPGADQRHGRGAGRLLTPSAPWRTPARRRGGDTGNASPRRSARGGSRSSARALGEPAEAQPATRLEPRDALPIRSSPSRSTVAYAVIADAPWVAVRGARAERSGTHAAASGRTPRAFWR